MESVLFFKEVENMTKLSRKLLTFGILAGAVVSVSACSAKGAEYVAGTPVKVGLICLHDTLSTYDKNFIDAMNAAVSELGASKVDGQAIIKTGVGENNEAYKAARDLVKQGCNVIFADSFGHEEFMLKAAKKYPNVQFCHATGTQAKVAGVANYHNAFASIYEGRYLAGYAAGLKLGEMLVANQLTANNFDANGNVKLGYVGAYPYAEVVSGYTSWYLGVKAAVGAAANLVMNVTFTKSWYDPDAEKTSAKSLIDGGAAIVSQHADSMGAPGECEERGVPNVSYNLALHEQCPNTYLAYSKIDWTPYYKNVINSVFAGKSTFEGEVNNNYTGTLASGSVIYDVVNPAHKVLCEQVKEQLMNGSRKVFDCANFTVDGQHLTSYQADVDDFGDFQPETEVIKQANGITYFDESALRSAPYFDIKIDGINQLNS